MNIDVMVDLETLSTQHNAGILSIGATTFNHEGMKRTFYEKVAVGCLERDGFHVSRSTLDWWNKQDPDTRAEAFSGKKELIDVLVELGGYLLALETPINLWGNGSDFDNVILTNAYDRFGISLPWSYKNNRCYRTLKSLYPQILPPAMIRGGMKHNALDDAKYQAAHAEGIFVYRDMLAQNYENM